MSTVDPTTQQLEDPNWDPIYGSDSETKQQHQVLDGLTFGLAGVGKQAANAGAVKTLQALQGPEYSVDGFSSAGDFNPEMFDGPQLIDPTTAQDSAEGRAAQLAALQELGALQDQSIGSQAALGRHRAAQDAAQFSNSREQAIKQDAMRRGKVGGNADMMLRSQAAQAGANQNLNAGLQSAQMAALQQLQGKQMQGQLAGQLRGQDQALSFKNADIINAAKTINTGATNAINTSNTGMRNEAAKGNLGTRQRVRDMNVVRGDDIANSKYAARAGKANSTANAMQGLATGQGQTDAARQSAGGQAIKGFLSAWGAGAAADDIT